VTGLLERQIRGESRAELEEEEYYFNDYMTILMRQQH